MATDRTGEATTGQEEPLAMALRQRNLGAQGGLPVFAMVQPRAFSGWGSGLFAHLGEIRLDY